ncbi:dihydrofolate reductase family protein [Dactylosporangium sp. NPDC000555]|uniref:dihydrofolate reductase family protein n=1 Tax=Dactylosporangium sp. NPDC000555 TaxID=3154260 RepID=UPI003329DEA5
MGVHDPQRRLVWVDLRGRLIEPDWAEEHDRRGGRAYDAAGGLDVRLAGGVSTIRQYLRAGLVDLLHLPIVPILLGRGERLLDDGLTGYTATSFTASDQVMHVVLTPA